MNLNAIFELQMEHRQWLTHNFPEQQPHDALLGLVEEVGELAHAHLKHQQEIRGYDSVRYHVDACDAIGDIFIYLMSYCNTNGFDLYSAIEDTWNKVKARDWQANPENAGDDKEPH